MAPRTPTFVLLDIVCVSVSLPLLVFFHVLLPTRVFFICIGAILLAMHNRFPIVLHIIPHQAFIACVAVTRNGCVSVVCVLCHIPVVCVVCHIHMVQEAC